LTKAQKKEIRIYPGIRNGIEGKFGEGKRKYQLDCVKIKIQMTSKSWISCVLFVMNLAHWLRVDLFVVFLQMPQKIYSMVVFEFQKSNYI
jgi:IS5 family transposase